MVDADDVRQQGLERMGRGGLIRRTVLGTALIVGRVEIDGQLAVKGERQHLSDVDAQRLVVLPLQKGQIGGGLALGRELFSSLVC